ncbi:hypothetical protein C8F04DRAFT_1279279 [Mycena alexandri]|uniref:CxC2-like cysteine cluster KDZ transposase-associated domain-containing protein n=1 Tax=Mycena alexandri TaxID=1745969 RepID=A0AAD6S055_9AGAR|nr:hypothetical protein C8F04DRAFT_1279279 [Mycena alexandri]
MSKHKGILQYRSQRLVDVSIGFRDEDQTQLGADRGVHISMDGNRRAEELLNITHKKRRLNPKHLNDMLARWIPAEDEEDLETDLADQISAVPEDLTSSAKRKCYTSSDDHMAEWRPMKQFFLDELMWGKAVGDSTPCCALCKKNIVETERLFKSRHALMPLHLIKEWKGEFWQPTSLRDMGLVYQLGHGGAACPFPAAKALAMTVIHTMGIHQLRYRYCNCTCSCTLGDNQHLVQLLHNRWYPATVTDPATCVTFNVLNLFHLLNVVGNVNCHDFMGSLERLTDAAGSTGMDWMPDRYKQFVRMSRQYTFLQSCKRQGRSHDPAGLAATQFLYMLIVAVDANFKLRNCLRKNEINDPSLGPGWGAFVESTDYKAHLKNYVAEKDISTCIAFAALLQKDTRMTTGLRVSGVGGVVCARHECMLPNGLGDLQKGERYANMDYILMSALAGFALLALTISYDIACQWQKNLPERNTKLDTWIRLDLERVNVQCGIPVWHAGSHEKECEDENSLKYLEGVGKSDGEGVERFWSHVGAGSIDYHNHQKNLSQGDALHRKLIVALAERAHQVEAFEEVSATISKDLQKEWRAQIAVFVEDHEQPNPYSLSKSDPPTEAETRLALKADEEAEARKGVTAFLVAGLQVEDAQRRILAEMAGLALMTADREGKLQERRLALISKLRTLQRIYTPGAIAAMEREEATRDPNAPPVPIEKTKLYLPSGLTEQQHATGCQRGIPAMEAKLRLAQCGDALANIRCRLHGKWFLIMFRDGNITGQVRATKSRTLIDSVGDRVTASAQKYTQARVSLIQLQGADSIPHFKELKPQDLTLDGQVEDADAAAVKKLKMIQAGKGKRTPRHIKGSSKQVMSWIWSAQGSMDSSEEQLHESMHIEWSRTLA